MFLPEGELSAQKARASWDIGLSRKLSHQFVANGIDRQFRVVGKV